MDAGAFLAGPLVATHLADFGADVIKIEHPDGDRVRHFGHAKDGVGLWWKEVGRNKRSVTLNLGTRPGQEIFRRLAKTADVVVENYRPGTFDRWGLGYDALAAENPGLILAHVSGFGQIGPKSQEPVFGTLAEAMSGFANRTGLADGPPYLPPFGVADNVAGLAGAFAVVLCLFHRSSTGAGQEIDLSLVDPLLSLLEPQIVVYDQLGMDIGRIGNRSSANAPRDLYRTTDNHWIAISAMTTENVVSLMGLVGREDLASAGWISHPLTRVEHSDDLDTAIKPWIAARTSDEALSALRRAEVPSCLVYGPKEILNDEQFEARESIVRVPDSELGPVRMPNVMFRLSATPGRIRWAGPRVGEHTDEVLYEAGLSVDELRRLREASVI